MSIRPVNLTPNMPHGVPTQTMMGIANQSQTLIRDVSRELAEHAHAINQLVIGPMPLTAYLVADLPVAADHTSSIVFVSNETGGATVAFSDGTNWRRVQDRAIVA